jgi:hypothetical protein
MPPKKNDKKSTPTLTRPNTPPHTGSPKKQRTESTAWKLPFSDAPVSAANQQIMMTKVNGYPLYTYVNIEAAKLFSYVTVDSP